MNHFELIGYLAGGVIVISMIPQIIKLLKTKKSRDVSLVMLLVILSGQTLWLIYGIHLNDKPLIISNILSSTFTITAVFLVLKYRHVESTN